MNRTRAAVTRSRTAPAGLWAAHSIMPASGHILATAEDSAPSTGTLGNGWGG